MKTGLDEILDQKTLNNLLSEDEIEIIKICSKYRLKECDLTSLTGKKEDIGKTFIYNEDSMIRNGYELALYIRRNENGWDAVGYITRIATGQTQSYSIKHYTLEEVYLYAVDIYKQKY